MEGVLLPSSHTRCKEPTVGTPPSSPFRPVGSDPSSSRFKAYSCQQSMMAVASRASCVVVGLAVPWLRLPPWLPPLCGGGVVPTLATILSGSKHIKSAWWPSPPVPRVCGGRPPGLDELLGSSSVQVSASRSLGGGAIPGTGYSYLR